MSEAEEACRKIQKALVERTPWEVSQGYGSFVDMHFGKIIKETTKTGRARTFGEWHIWVYCCGWRILDKNDDVLAHSESSREEIEYFLSQMRGTALTALGYDPNTGELTLPFACGLAIRTSPEDEYYKDAEYVLIFTPDKHVLSFGPNKELAYRRSDASRQFN